MRMISTVVFAIWIVQSLYYLNPKFQDSSHLLRLYRPVCVGPGGKPQRPVFSQRCLFLIQLLWLLQHMVETSVALQGRLPRPIILDSIHTMWSMPGPSLCRRGWESGSCSFRWIWKLPVADMIMLRWNILKFLTSENFAVIYLKLKQRGQTLGYFVKKMQM